MFLPALRSEVEATADSLDVITAYGYQYIQSLPMV